MKTGTPLKELAIMALIFVQSPPARPALPCAATAPVREALSFSLTANLLPPPTGKPENLIAWVKPTPAFRRASTNRNL